VRKLLLLCAFTLAVTASLSAQAQALPTCASPRGNPLDTNLKWTAPTQYTDGTAIAAGTVITYTVYQADAAGDFKIQCTTTGLSGTQFHAAAGLTYRYYVTATVNGEPSAPSAIATRTTPKPVPKQPTGVTAGP